MTRAERIDRYVAAALIVLAQIELWVGHAISGPPWLAAPLSVLVCSTVAFRRRRPLLAGLIGMAGRG